MERRPSFIERAAGRLISCVSSSQQEVDGYEEQRPISYRPPTAKEMKTTAARQPESRGRTPIIKTAREALGPSSNDALEEFIPAVHPHPSQPSLVEQQSLDQIPSQSSQIRSPAAPLPHALIPAPPSRSRTPASVFDRPLSQAKDISQNGKPSASSQAHLLHVGWDALVTIEVPKAEGSTMQHPSSASAAQASALPPQQLDAEASEPVQRFFDAIDHADEEQQPATEASGHPTTSWVLQEDFSSRRVPTPQALMEEASGQGATPQALLQDIAKFIAVNDQAHVLAALLMLERGMQDHTELLTECLEELVFVILSCITSFDNSVVLAALTCATRLVRKYGDNVFQYLHIADDQRSFIVQLINCATGNRRPRPIQVSAEKALRLIATKLHQPSCIRVLEQLSRAGSINPAVRAKAASLLLMATYRLS